MSKPSYKSIAKYNKKAYDRLAVTIPKGRRSDIAEYVAQNGETINGLINRLLQNELGLRTSEWKRKEAV